MENKDLISRKALIDWFMPYVHSGIEKIPVETVIEDIKTIPSADVVPVVHGKLVSTGYDELYCEFGNCTVCGADNPTSNKYCGQCGAKMDGVEK